MITKGVDGSKSRVATSETGQVATRETSLVCNNSFYTGNLLPLANVCKSGVVASEAAS